MEITQQKKDLRRAANTSGIMMILFYLLSIGAAFLVPWLVLHFVSFYDRVFQDVYAIAAYIVQYLVIVPVLLLVFRLLYGKRAGLRIGAGFCKPTVPVSRMLKWILMCCGIIYAVSYASSFANAMLTAAIESLTGFEVTAPDMAAGDSLLSKCTNILAIVILAPLFEELLFRASIYRSLERFGQWPAAIVCGLLFGLWHSNYVQTVYACVMGVCACFLAAKTGTVLSAYLLHLGINLIGGIQSLVVGNIDAEQLAAGEIEMTVEYLSSLLVVLIMGFLIIVLMLTGLILLLLELLLHRETFRLKKSETDIGFGRAMCLMLTSPGIVIACVFMLFMTLLRALGIW